jgi:glycosyltransferase involved in cell wall biosynthesis
MPRVSVIIPAFNAELYIAGTLDSVAAQTYRDWEAIVVDDASTDNTARIAERSGDRFTVIRGAANAGLAASRNRAIDAARGELLAFLDADDLWLPEYLDSQVAAYDQACALDANVGIVSCDARVLTEDAYLRETYLDAIGKAAEITLTRLLTGNFIYVSALSPRNVVDEAGRFATGLYGVEDYDLWLRIVEGGYRVVRNPRVLAIYRLTPGSMSTDTSRMAIGTQRVYERALTRGRLTHRQERIARRQIRLYRLVQAIAEPPSGQNHREWPDFIRTFGLTLRVFVENPSRWGELARRLFGRRPSPLLQRRPG